MDPGVHRDPYSGADNGSRNRKLTRLYSLNFTDLYSPSGTLDSPVSDSEDKVQDKEKSVDL